jgi:hypothetical protein
MAEKSIRGGRSRERQAWSDHVGRKYRVGDEVLLGGQRYQCTAGPKTGRVKGARATLVDGIKFPSKLEADRYRELKLLRASGAVLYFLRQVPFVVAPGVGYRCDFLVVWDRIGTPHETITVEDCKGHLTGESRIKIAAVQDRYGIKIKLLSRKDVSR